MILILRMKKINKGYDFVHCNHSAGGDFDCGKVFTSRRKYTRVYKYCSQLEMKLSEHIEDE